MKTSHYLQLASVLTLGLSACKPVANTAADDEARRQMEATRAAYEQQAADMQSRSEALQKQLADLERSIKDKENADLRAKLDAISAENQKLMADAASARKKSEDLRDQLASNRYTPPAVTQPYQPAYVPPQINPVAPSRPWVDPSADYSMFYDSLNPHGRWLNVDGYGYAFSPRIGSRSNWRPYVDGRWVSTNQGWAWDSNEPFGWACYHYGRWTRIARYGWVWIPGRQWAPSWVSWRYGSDSVGWAPLPPAVGYGSIGHDCDARYGIAPTSYTFIRATNFGRSSYVNVSLSITNITQIFHQTINVTNIVQVRQQQNNLFIQRGGPALDWVEKRCGERIERAPIQIVNTLERPGEHRPGHSDHGFIAAPLPSGRADRPNALPRDAERVSTPTVVDAWTEVPADKRDDLRKAITEQATEAQPKPVLAVTDPIIVAPVNEALAQPAIPAPRVPEVPGRNPGKGDAPAMPQLEMAQDAANKADLARLEAERQMKEAEAEREKQAADQKAAEVAMAAKQEELAKKQAEAVAMQEQLAEQAKKDTAMREKQASEMSDKEAAALKEKQAAEMAAQQAELAKKQAESLAMQEQIAEQEKKAQAMREEQAAIMKQQEAEAAKAKEVAAMAAQQEAAARKQAEAAVMAQQEAAAKEAAMQAEALKQKQMQDAQDQAEEGKIAEMEAVKARDNAMAAQQAAQEEQARRQAEAAAMNAQKEAAMQAQQEAAERQRLAAMEAQREANMQAQQEAAERQRQAAMEAQREAAMQAQQEAAERQRQATMEAQREAAMQAQQEAAERQRQAAMEAQREAQMRAQQEAAERQREAAMEAQREAQQRAQQEAMERQREAAMRAQQEAQEAMRQQQQEAARRAQEEAMRAQQEAAQRAAAEEAARRAAQQPPPGQ